MFLVLGSNLTSIQHKTLVEELHNFLEKKGIRNYFISKHIRKIIKLHYLVVLARMMA